jgi:hypothetical protein
VAGETVADSEYTIRVEASDVGADATAQQVHALADSLDAAERVVTEFDGALEAAGAQLADAASAVESTNAALSETEGTYNRLERAATAAAKRVEKAAAAGKDTSELRAAADAAAAAVSKQAKAVDRARGAARSAAKAHDKLASSYKSIEKAAGRAAEASRGQERSFADLFGAAGALGGPLGGVAGQISGIGDGLRAGGKGGGLILLGFAAANALITLTKAAVGLGVALLVGAGALLKFAVAADKTTSDKLSKAWEKAGKNFKKLFEGVKTEKLIRPVTSLLNLLNKNTSAGKGLAKIFETLLNPIIDGLDKGEPLIKEFFKGLIIGALKAIIVVLMLRNAILRAVPKETREKIKEFIDKLFSLGNAAKAGEGVFKVLTFAVLALVGAFVLLAGVMLIPVAILALFTVGPILAVVLAVKKLQQAFKGAGKEAKAGGQEAGTGWSQGVIAGIMAGIGPAAKAARALIKAVTGGAKEEAKAKSPSRVMFAFGHEDLAGAVSLGLYRGVPEVRRAGKRVGRAAIESTTEERAPSRGRAPSQSVSRRGGDRTINVHPGAVQIVVQGGEDLRDAARRAAEELIEMVIIQLGGEPVSGEA